MRENSVAPTSFWLADRGTQTPNWRRPISACHFARRLHDTGRVGWWILIAFVPLIGGIWLLILMVLEGNSGDNAYGPPPRRTPEG